MEVTPALSRSGALDIRHRLTVRVPRVRHATVLAALTIALFTMLVAVAGGPWPTAPAAFPLIIVGVYATLCLITVARAVAAWALGFQVVRASVGPIVLTPQSTTLLTFQCRHWRDFVPSALCLPNGDDDLPRQTALYVFAGPCAVVVVWLVELVVGLSGSGVGAWPFGARVAGYVVLSATPLIALWAALVGITLPSGMTLTWRGRRQDLAYFDLLGHIAAGERPRNWNLQPLVDTDLAGGYTGHSMGTRLATETALLGYYQALDAGNTAAAEHALERALAEGSACGPTLRAAVVHEAAFFAARMRKDVETALGWLSETSWGDVAKPTRLRAEAAILFADGRRAEACDLAQAALPALDHEWDRGLAAAERDWLRDIVSSASRL